MKQSMQSQMGIGAEIIEQVWDRLRPYELPALREMPPGRIIVVRGSYDNVEKILRNAKIPYTLTSMFPGKKELGQGSKYQDCKVMFVNCDENYHDSYSECNGLREAKKSLVDFVESGGRMITTDWAQRVVRCLFGKIKARAGVLSERVVEIKFPSYIGKNLLGINYQGAKPKWWIESSSDAIYPLKQSGIVELISSSNPDHIAIGFRKGNGEVFHFVSHLIAQKFRHDSSRDRQNLQQFLEQTKTKLSSAGKGKNITFAGIETTYTLMNTVLELIRDRPILV